MIDVETNKIIKTFESISLASDTLNLSVGGNITRVCQGKQKTCGGYRWQYATLRSEGVADEVILYTVIKPESKCIADVSLSIEKDSSTI